MSIKMIREIEIYWNHAKYRPGDTIALYTSEPTNGLEPIYTLVPNAPSGIKRTGLQATFVPTSNLTFARQCLRTCATSHSYIISIYRLLVKRKSRDYESRNLLWRFIAKWWFFFHLIFISAVEIILFNLSKFFFYKNRFIISVQRSPLASIYFFFFSINL